MTRRKDPQPEADPEPGAASPETVAAEPLVVTDPPEPPPAVPEPSLQPKVVVRRGSFVAPLLGGALAAAGGFALSHFDILDLRPDGSSAELASLTSEIADIKAGTASLDTLRGDLAALSDRVEQLEGAPLPESPDLSRIDALDQRLAAIEAMPTDGLASTAALTSKLADLERRLAAMPQGASPELQQDLDAALERLDQAEASAKARADEAAAAAAAATRVRLLDALASRLTAGEPFGPELQSVDDAALTDVLSPFAETGAPTVADLQAAFPDAARDALQIARASRTGDSWSNRVLDFLSAQTGARPLTPLEGDTPEAILSRADFALSEGRVADAVAEVQSLGPDVKAALNAWLGQAETHLAATAALAAARGE
jgi:hypothetical protein